MEDTIELIFETQISNYDLKIAPLILITFIENAFKHGISFLEKSKITINIKNEGNELILKVENSFFRDKTNFNSTKVGIKNTINRLNFIYPNKYTLDIIDNETIYKTILRINLL